MSKEAVCYMCGFTKLAHAHGRDCPTNHLTTYIPAPQKGKPVTTQPDFAPHALDRTIIMSTGDRYRVGFDDAERIKDGIKEMHPFIEVVTTDGRRVLIAPKSVAIIEA